MIVISFDWDVYIQHKEVLLPMALSLQKDGNKVGIVTGERDNQFDSRTGRTVDKKKQILDSLGFTPDFFHIWGETETIASGSGWKAQKMEDENISLHFDDDGTDLKKWTKRWVAKLMLNGQENKF